MTDKIKKGDFVELDYSGFVKEGNILFDTTVEKVAKDNGAFNPKAKYQPIVICIGEHQLLPALDNFLEGKETGKLLKIELKTEEAFGKKNAKLIKIIPANVFKKERIEPQTGLQVNIDGQYGIIMSAGGGRVVVDFNSALAGKDVSYELKPIRIITDSKEKIQEYLSLMMNIGKEHLKVEVKDGKATITLPATLPEQLTKPLSEKIAKLTGVKSAEFASSEPKEAAKEEHKHQH